MARLKVTQTRSEIGGKQNQRDTLRTLGLKRIGDVVVKEDRPEIRGMVKTVTHLVAVEEVEHVLGGVPRVSGDEPPARGVDTPAKPCSPRERG